jgi:hypothetical protein
MTQQQAAGKRSIYSKQQAASSKQQAASSVGGAAGKRSIYSKQQAASSNQRGRVQQVATLGDQHHFEALR